MIEPAELDDVVARLGNGERPAITVRELLGWFGAERRGARIVSEIRKKLRSKELRTEPDFEEVWIDAKVQFDRDNVTPSADHASTSTTEVAAGTNGRAQRFDAIPISLPTDGPKLATRVVADGGVVQRADPVQRIGRLPAANREVCSVPPGSNVDLAITKMMLNDYSQIPVIQSRSCKGAVTWRSLGRNFALKRETGTVNNCLEPVDVVGANVSVLSVIPTIVKSGFVLVQAKDNTFQGIVTTADISEQFHLLSEPFVLIGQIENHIRILVQRAASVEQMREVKHPSDTTREVEDEYDLTFGEYVRLFERSDIWAKLSIGLERRAFIERAHEVGGIRNDVMHFDPDGISEKELATLRTFARFLEDIEPS